MCAGAGAILAMASDLRCGTARSKVAFLFVRVGLAGADMGACNMLPRIIGAGRAAELLYTGRAMDGGEAERWGFYNKLSEPDALLADAQALAKSLSDGPTFANSMTKRCLHQEWSMGIDDAIEAEAQAQAICMQTKDYERAYEAFVTEGEAKVRGQLKVRNRIDATSGGDRAGDGGRRVNTRPVAASRCARRCGIACSCRLDRRSRSGSSRS